MLTFKSLLCNTLFIISLSLLIYLQPPSNIFPLVIILDEKIILCNDLSICFV